MVYDSIANASIPTAASNSKDFGKKKRVNRTAKLKQSKLDVRREQWLSQVKNRGLGFKEETKVTGGVKMAVAETHAAVNEKDLVPIVKLEVSVGAEENEGLINGYSDSESLSNSPTNFTGSSSRSSSSSSGSGSGGCGCFSRSMTDEDDADHDHDDNHDNDNDDDCLDDWETMADALAADDIQKTENENDTNLESSVHETALEPDSGLTKRSGQEAHRAWRPDDASRPQSLPNLLKQNSFPIQSGLHHGVRFAPSSCPICCEDLDMTDSSFLPCPCGYRLCLFCHKRILEENGRCPGCRKQYDQIDHDHKTAPFKLACCYSANPRR